MAKNSSTVGKNQCHSKGVPLCTLDRIKSEHIHLNKRQILKCRNHRNPYWFNSCVKMFPPSVSRSRNRSQWGTIRWFPTTWRGKTLSGGDKVVNTIRGLILANIVSWRRFNFSPLLLFDWASDLATGPVFITFLQIHWLFIRPINSTRNVSSKKLSKW